MNDTTLRWILGMLFALSVAWAGWITTSVIAMQIESAVLKTQLFTIQQQVTTVSTQVASTNSNVVSLDNKLSVWLAREQMQRSTQP